MKNYVPGTESHVFLSVLCYMHMAWSFLMALIVLVIPSITCFLLFNISGIIFIPPIRKLLVKNLKIPYWVIIIMRFIIVIVSYVVFVISVPLGYYDVWKSEDGMVVDINKNRVILTENNTTNEYKYKSILPDTGAYVIVLENNYKFVYYQKGNNIDFCLLDQDGNKCTKYLIPEKPSSSYHYRTSE